MRSHCAPSVLMLAALFGQLALAAPASAGKPLRLCLGALRTEGLSDEGAQQT